MMAGGDQGGGTGSARRRRERRLRSMLRHERMAVAMALAEALHHSSGTTPSKRDTRVVEGAKYDALRGQKAVTRAREGEVREEHLALRGQTRLPPGMRPALLVGGAAAGACGAALCGASGRACTVGANSRCSCAAGGRQRDGCLPVPGSADDRADYRSAQDLLPSVSFSFSGSCPADSGTVGGSADCVVVLLAPAADCRADHWYCGSGS